MPHPPSLEMFTGFFKSEGFFFSFFVMLVFVDPACVVIINLNRERNQPKYKAF